MATKTLTALEAEAQEAATRLAEAQAAAQAAREKEQARQVERARQLNEKLCADYDDQAHFRAIRQARQAFDQAVADSPIGQAWIELQMVRARHAHAAAERNAAAARLGRHDDRVLDRPGSGAAITELAEAVDRIANDRMAAELDSADAARDRAITGR